MNSQRLLAMSNSLAAELQTMNLVGLINTLSSELQQAINSPSEATQRAVQTTRDNLAEMLSKDSGQNKSPIFEQFSGLLLACSETWTWKPPWS